VVDQVVARGLNAECLGWEESGGGLPWCRGPQGEAAQCASNPATRDTRLRRGACG